MAPTREQRANALYNEGLEHFKAGRHEEAVRCYRKSARLGCKEAQYNLGVCLYKGEGVRKDLVEAAEWLSKSAAQG